MIVFEHNLQGEQEPTQYGYLIYFELTTNKIKLEKKVKLKKSVYIRLQTCQKSMYKHIRTYL